MAIDVPSFWDYLGNAIDRGHQGFQDRRQRDREQAMQELSVLSTLFGQGAVDSSAVQGALGKVGMGGVNVAANPAEARRKIVNAPPIRIGGFAGGTMNIPGVGAPSVPGMEVSIPGSATATDDQRRFAGLPTSTEMVQDSLERRRAQIAMKQANNQPITDEEAIAAGLKPAWQTDAEKRSKIDPATTAAAGRHVAGIVNRRGRIPSGGVALVAEQAFQAWLAERQKSKLGALTPEDTEYARSFFEGAARDAFTAQQEMDLEGRRVGAAEQNARRLASGSAGDPTRWFRALTARVNANQREMNSLLSQHPMLKFAIENPRLAGTPELQGALQQYQALSQHNTALTTAQSQSGITPEQIQALVGPVDADGNPVGAAPAAPGGAGTGNVNLGAAPAMTDAQLNQAASRMRQMPANQRAAYIDSAVQSGSLSAEDGAKLKAKVGG